MVKIAFATDQHISLDIKNGLGVDTQGNFMRMLGVIQKRNYDALILGGDLCLQDGDLTTYQWFMDTLKSISIPYYIISGNHDEPAMIHSICKNSVLQPSGELYYKSTIGGIDMLFLDTTKGMMTDDQFVWFRNQVIDIKSENCWISMHHPPIWSGSKHMDEKYAFQQIEIFFEVCQEFPNINFFIFAGHCHMERMIHQKNMRVFITPSSYVNIDPDFSDFSPLILQKSGYRELIWDHDSFYTNVYYVD